MDWTGPRDWTYKFYTEDGVFEISYDDYIGDFKNTHIESDLMRNVKDRLNRTNLYLGRTIMSYDKRWLKHHKSEAEMVKFLGEEQDKNPLQFYCPNGMNMLRMLNDTDSSIKGIISPNRTGKTTVGWIDLLLDIIPCDPKWKIFTEHGVIWRPFTPPRDGFVVAAASYEKINIESTLWPQVIKKWTPTMFIQEYIDGKRTINFKDSPKIVNKYVSIYLMYYSMSQTPFESQAIDRFLWDEQGEERKFDGADERLRTRSGRHVFSLTPHKVEGRPDTGAGTWIHDLDLGTTTKGHKVSFYKQSMLDGVPDWIYPEKQKIIAYDKWIKEPQRLGHNKVYKEGMSRLFGEWHETGGLVYDEWDRKIHLIDPFEIPKDWTRYRAIDWGRVKPTACVWGAVDPSGDLYIYDTYLRENALVSDSAQDIIRQSGNETRLVDEVFDNKTGEVYKRYEEVFKSNKFYATVMDSRSMKSKAPDAHITIGRIYMNNGLMVRPACADDTYLTVPIVKEWLKPDFTKNHPFTGEPGRPRVYIFRNQSKFINHIEHYVNADSTRKDRSGNSYLAERPVAKDDHDLDAFRYLIMIPPRYIPGFSDIDTGNDETYTKKEIVDSYTGY